MFDQGIADQLTIGLGMAGRQRAVGSALRSA
jgi:hypothetical protein